MHFEIRERAKDGEAALYVEEGLSQSYFKLNKEDAVMLTHKLLDHLNKHDISVYRANLKRTEETEEKIKENLSNLVDYFRTLSNKKQNCFDVESVFEELEAILILFNKK